MAEEQRFQEANNHVLCANNCGFFGSPTTLNLCSKCYKDHCLKERQISTAKIAVEKSLTPPQQQPEPKPSVSYSFASVAASVRSEAPRQEAAGVNRCSSCRRRVGLTGFMCKCGTTFCGAHRYPEEHGCTFDFKAVGKAAIAKANPVVKAAKLEKI